MQGLGEIAATFRCTASLSFVSFVLLLVLCG
jgi:hypothetical protein